MDDKQLFSTKEFVIVCVVVLAGLAFVMLVACSGHLHLHIKEQHEHKHYDTLNMGDADPVADGTDMIKRATKEAIDGLAKEKLEQ